MVIKDPEVLKKINREGLIDIILMMDKALDTANEIIESQEKIIDKFKKIM